MPSLYLNIKINFISKYNKELFQYYNCSRYSDFIQQIGSKRLSTRTNESKQKMNEFKCNRIEACQGAMATSIANN